MVFVIDLKPVYSEMQKYVQLHPLMNYYPPKKMLEDLACSSFDVDYNEIVWCSLENALDKNNVDIFNIDAGTYENIDIFISICAEIFYEYIRKQTQQWCDPDSLLFDKWLNDTTILMATRG